MTTSSPVLALPLPTATDSDQVPADLMTLMTAGELFMVGRFASQAERTSKIAAPVRGMVSFVTADGYPTWYDGSIWRPFSGQRLAVINPAANAAAFTVAVDFTTAGSIPSYTFPVTVHFEWMGLVTQATTTDVIEGYLQVDGSLVKRQRFDGAVMSFSGSVEVDYAAGASHTFKTTATHNSGSGIANIYGDGSLNYCQATVRAQ